MKSVHTLSSLSFLLVTQTAIRFIQTRLMAVCPATVHLLAPWKSVQAIINTNKIEYYTPSTADTLHFILVNAGAPVKGGDTIISDNTGQAT